MVEVLVLLRRSGPRGLIVALLGALVPLACGDSSVRERLHFAALTQGCILDSDCKQPLVCVFERCHVECEATRDCPDGQRCVLGEASQRVCLLPDETECVSDAGCWGEQVCALDRECRDPCTSADDCVMDQTCASSQACAESDELNADGDLKPWQPTSAKSGSGGSGGSAGSSGVGGSSGGGIGAGADGGTSGGSMGGSSSGGSSSGGSSSGGSSSGGSSSGGSSSGGGSGGASGSGGSATSCPTGTGDCDDNPEDCEADLTLITQCGACNRACNGLNTQSVACASSECVVECREGYADCDGKPENGCEESLIDNAQHCGACARDCARAGASCEGSRCSVAVLRSASPKYVSSVGTQRWRANGSALYYVDQFDYELVEVPLDASAPSRTLWQGPGAVTGRFSLVVNDTEVVWSQRGNENFVLRKPLSAPEHTVPEILFQPGYLPYFLQVRGNAYYWMSGDFGSGDPGSYVYTRGVNADASDPGVQIVSQSQGTHGEVLWFTTTTDALYWYTIVDSAYEMRTTPLAGGTPSVVPGGPITSAIQSASPLRMLTLGNSIFYNQDVGTADTNGIYRWTPGDSLPTQLVQAENVVSFLLDDDVLYYIVAADLRRVYRAPLAGGVGEEIAQAPTGASQAELVHQDASYLYLAHMNSSGTNIYRVVK